MSPVPHEFAIGEVFLSPWLVSATLGVLLTGVTQHVLRRYRLSRYFAHPPLVLLALTVIYTVAVGHLVIGA